MQSQDSTQVRGESASSPVVQIATLEELAARANREHRLVVQAGIDMIDHAIKAGEALLEAKGQIPWGGWKPWLDENFEQSRVNAAIYMRIARYREVVLGSEVTSINAARRMLAEHVKEKPRHPKHLELEAEARRLKAEGLPQNAIAEFLDVNPEQVTYWCNPGAYRKRVEGNRRRRQRAREARIALERQNRDRAVKKAGGAGSRAYSLIRKTAQELELAEREAATREHRAHVRAAIAALHTMEDELVLALGVAHGAKDRRSLKVVAA